MTIPFDKPMVSPVIVGRAPHIAALDAALTAACAGQGSVILLAGEAGVGKSRLIAEGRARAIARGMAVFEGRCFEPDRTLPDAPLLDLLRAHFAGQPADAIPPEITHLLPELAPNASPAPEPDHEQDQRRLAQALVELITQRAEGRAALVIIEDLHWSDDASLDVLLHLARRLATQAVLLLFTYRSDEITPSLRHALATLDRERLASEIALARLAMPEVDAMLRAIFEQALPIRADFLHAIFELTDGNPFFIEEVVGSLVATGDIFRIGGRWERRALAQLQIPRSVQDAVLRRTEHLSPDAIAVLRLAAVAGRFFDFDVLRELTGHDEGTLLALIRALIAAQFVVEASMDRFAFRHALTRQAIYQDMLARERRALHRAIAETIERLHTTAPEPALADLSYHFAAGEAWAKAIEYCERAGMQALARDAPRAAADHFNRAADAATRIAVAPSARLYRARAQALATLGDFNGAQADLQTALACASAAGDRLSEWQAVLALGGLWAGYDYTRAGAFFTQALDLARTLDNPLAVAETLTQLGSWYLNTERTDEAEENLQHALTLFEEAGDRRGIARAIDLLGTVSDIAGDIAEMRRRYERAAALFRELGDRQALSSTLATMAIAGGAYIFETVALPPHTPPEQTMRWADESLALAREIGWRAGESYTLGNMALHFSAYGAYGRALESAQEGLAIAHELDHREWMTAGEWTQGMILSDLLARSRAHGHFIRAHALGRESGSLHWLYLTAGNVAESHVARGDPSAAEAVLAPIADDLPMRTLGQRRVWTARAKLAHARGDPAGAIEIIERLAASAAARTGVHDIPLLALLRSESLMALERHHEAEEPLRTTLAIATERGLRGICWRSHRALGHLAVACGRATEARAHYHAARTIIEDLATTLPPGELRDTFVACAMADFPADRTRSTGQPADLLTRRERDVAILVARGLSNREIADTLSIGERTVETHVGNILSKLDATSRAQIAIWATESGLGRVAERA